MEEYNGLAQDILAILQPRLVLESQRLGRPAYLAIGDFRNKTNKPLANFATNKDVMYGEIRKVLVNSGLVRVNMGMAGTGGETDSLLGNMASLRDSIEYDQSTVKATGTSKAPDFIVWGDIINVVYSEGRTTNNDYALNLRLIEVASELTVFEDQVQLQKQFQKGLFGG
jgi:hypothetical protein